MKNTSSTPSVLKFQSFFSRTVGQIVLGVTGIVYANQLWMSPLDKVVGVGLTAFGAIAAVAALCFTMASCLTSLEERQPTLYAGEKFFHSSLLLIQTIFIRFAGDSLASMQFIQGVEWLHRAVGGLASFAATITGAVATWFSIWGFQSLNDFLWQRYEKWREELIEKKKEK